MNPSKRIFWDNEEVAKLAREFVFQRFVDPFTSDAKLLVKAMHKAIPQTRWRKLNAMDQVPSVKKSVEELWAKEVANPNAPAASPPPPTIIEVEIERPVNYVELAERLDGPTLAALAFHKMEKVMSQLSVARVEAPKVATPALARPPLSVLQAASPARVRLTRVVVIALQNEWQHIKEKAAGLTDRLELVFFDPDKTKGTVRTDYVVYKATTSHAVTEPYENLIGRNRVYRIEGGINSLVQKLYDIASLKGAA